MKVILLIDKLMKNIDLACIVNDDEAEDVLFNIEERINNLQHKAITLNTVSAKEVLDEIDSLYEENE